MRVIFDFDKITIWISISQEQKNLSQKNSFLHACFVADRFVPSSEEFPGNETIETGQELINDFYNTFNISFTICVYSSSV